MGIDACIEYTTKENKTISLIEKQSIIRLLAYNLSTPSVEITRQINDDDSSEYFGVDSTHSYYGPGYERGDWPILCTALSILMNNDCVTNVWYFGDSEERVLMNHKRLHDYSVHYGAVFNDPYHSKYK